MINLTFDHNLVIDLEEHRENEFFLLRLVEAHKSGIICIRLAGSGHSERLKDRSFPTTGNEFTSKLKAAGIEFFGIQPPLLQFDVSPLDSSVFGSKEEIGLRKNIHRILFPNDLNILNAKRNHEMDASVMWCHIHYGGDIFVTSDKNFSKKEEALIALGAKTIMTPSEVVKSLGL